MLKLKLIHVSKEPWSPVPRLSWDSASVIALAALHWKDGVLMLGLHRIATNLGAIYNLKNSEFLGLVISRWTFIVRSQASVYIDVGERLTYE